MIKNGYTYKTLENDILKLENKYKFIEKIIIGKSVEGRNLYTLKIGKGKRNVFICGGMHACEWITCPVLIRWLSEICQLYISSGSSYGRSIEELFKKTTIHILPMVNPDGIELQINGVSPYDPSHNKLLKINNYNTDFSKWKSNINGVDINRNFNARWQEAKEIEKTIKIKGPYLDTYGGRYPESEPETQAITSYTRQENFDLILAYHTQGQEIYWEFDDIYIEGARELGERLAKASGYSLTSPDENSSYAGYKDWFIKEFKKPGYTIECGLGVNPLPTSQFNQIYYRNFELILIAAWGE